MKMKQKSRKHRKSSPSLPKQLATIDRLVARTETVEDPRRDADAPRAGCQHGEAHPLGCAGEVGGKDRRGDAGDAHRGAGGGGVLPGPSRKRPRRVPRHRDRWRVGRAVAQGFGYVRPWAGSSKAASRRGCGRPYFLIARVAGVPLETVLSMTPAQFDGWQLHIARYPPPEFLLATILTALLPKSDKIFDLTGHWLESPAAREIRKAARRGRRSTSDGANSSRRHTAKSGRGNTPKGNSLGWLKCRVASARIDFIARNARFVAGIRRNVEALQRQQRAVRSLRQNIRSVQSVGEQHDVPAVLDPRCRRGAYRRRRLRTARAPVRRDRRLDAACGLAPPPRHGRGRGVHGGAVSHFRHRAGNAAAVRESDQLVREGRPRDAGARQDVDRADTAVRAVDMLRLSSRREQTRPKHRPAWYPVLAGPGRRCAKR